MCSMNLQTFVGHPKPVMHHGWHDSHISLTETEEDVHVDRLYAYGNLRLTPIGSDKWVSSQRQCSITPCATVEPSLEVPE
jgi:hypothetical protein